MATARHDPASSTVPAAPPRTRADLVRAIDALVEECRAESLWYFRPDYRPSTDLERRQVLDAIQERSTLDVFRRAGTLKAWLSLLSSDGSASS